MDGKNSILLIGAIAILFGYIRYNEDLYYGSKSHLNEINVHNKDFIHINSDLPMSHMIKLNDKFLICSGLNYPDIYIKKDYLFNTIDNGGIYSYNITANSSIPTKHINNIIIISLITFAIFSSLSIWSRVLRLIFFCFTRVILILCYSRIHLIWST